MPNVILAVPVVSVRPCGALLAIASGCQGAAWRVLRPHILVVPDMRVFELTAHLQKFSRAEGRSATAAAAYRSCSAIPCEREGLMHDYRQKGGLEASRIVLPAGAPAWASDRVALWNAAELRERNGKRGRNADAFKARAVTAREIMFGFPAELSEGGRLAVADRIARHLVEVHGVATDLAIHQPGKEGDQRNHHCHMMLTSRRLTVDGLGEKTREWDGFKSGSAALVALRAFLAQTMNDALAHEGKGAEVYVEHRSLKARGSGRAPQKHMGPGKTHALRTTLKLERLAWERGARERQAGRHAEELARLAGKGGEAAARLAAAHAGENAQLDRAILARRARVRANEAVSRQHYAEQHRARQHDALEQGRRHGD